ncbi:MAG: alpha/beta fold hydrolase [Candidatus Rokuibacteriota bacterium]
MEHRTARVNGIRMHYVVEGSGPPVVLLHGWPQTWYCWRKIIPTLARRYTVLAPDLRGYGDSDKPSTGYDKRTMASDVHELARGLGHARIRLVGHDRGARVAHRYALDHEDAVERLALLDIIPTRITFARLDARSARDHWHWLFHQVPDLPELLVGANVEAYLRYFFHAWSDQTGVFTPEDVRVYVHAFSQPGALRAGFDDYRAGATIDLEQDAADATRRLKPPLLVLWGGEGRRGKSEVLDVWRGVADDVRGEPILHCGHFLPEEQPDVVSAKLLDFLA